MKLILKRIAFIPFAVLRGFRLMSNQNYRRLLTRVQQQARYAGYEQGLEEFATCNREKRRQIVKQYGQKPVRND